MNDESEQLIERYLTNDLSASEKQVVEERLTQDQAFRAEFELMRQAHLAGWIGGQAQLLEQLQARGLARLQSGEDIPEIKVEEEEELASPSTSVVPLYRRPWVWAVAAVVILLIVFVLQPPASRSLPELYAAQIGQNKQDLRWAISLGRTDSLLSAAQQAYRAQQFGQASDLLTQLLAETPNRPDLIYYLGLSQLQGAHPVQAAETLERVPDTATLYPRAQWYRILAFLAADDVFAAKHALERILTDPVMEAYHEQARQLLKQLPPTSAASTAATGSS